MHIVLHSEYRSAEYYHTAKMTVKSLSWLMLEAVHTFYSTFPQQQPNQNYVVLDFYHNLNNTNNNVVLSNFLPATTLISCL